MKSFVISFPERKVLLEIPLLVHDFYTNYFEGVSGRYMDDDLVRYRMYEDFSSLLELCDLTLWPRDSVWYNNAKRDVFFLFASALLEHDECDFRFDFPVSTRSEFEAHFKTRQDKTFMQSFFPEPKYLY